MCVFAHWARRALFATSADQLAFATSVRLIVTRWRARLSTIAFIVDSRLAQLSTVSVAAPTSRGSVVVRARAVSTCGVGVCVPVIVSSSEECGTFNPCIRVLRNKTSASCADSAERIVCVCVCVVFVRYCVVFGVRQRVSACVFVCVCAGSPCVCMLRMLRA